MSPRPPTLTEIWQAQQRIHPFVMRTPLRRAVGIPVSADTLYLKLEQFQATGSFKVRGAFNLLLQLDEEARARGLVAASAGNHGAAVSYAANMLGISNARIFVPGNAPRTKIDKIASYGAQVEAVGETYDDAHHAAEAYRGDKDATFVHAYDDPRTVAGAGTIGLEIFEDAPEVDAVLVPVGGGGLISGIAVAIKSLAPRVRIYAVQPDASPALRDSLRDGICYEEYTAAPTICDGLAGGIGQTVFQVAKNELIDETLVVSESAVHAAVAELAFREQLLVEGSGAVGLAALREFPAEFSGKRVAVVVTGANIDGDRLTSILNANPNSTLPQQAR